MDVAKSVVLPTATLVLGDSEHEGHKAGGERGRAFCTWECCRAWVLTHYPPVQRYEVLVLIDIISCRLVGLREEGEGEAKRRGGRTRRPRTAPGRV